MCLQSHTLHSSCPIDENKKKSKCFYVKSNEENNNIFPHLILSPLRSTCQTFMEHNSENPLEKLLNATKFNQRTHNSIRFKMLGLLKI